MDQADREIDHLRATRRLYESLPEQSAALRAPLDDAPELQQGLFSLVAEESLGGTGFWGLAVPEAFGGSGCSLLELVHAITRMAANAPTAAGMLSVHSSIGAVSALVAFGSAEQRLRYLPGLAQGSPLSIFGATEPDAGCDLSRIRTTIARRDGRLFLSGTKMFITGATYGRMVKLLALLDGHASVVLVRLPETDTATFRLRGYALHPLKHAHNAAIEFDRFEVHASDLLVPMSNGSPADGMQIVWHGLNRGRVTLAAQAAGTLRILLAGARDHAIKRHTWSAPIGSRQLVQGRLARIAASALACDSLAAWAAQSIDNGQTGEWEAITAKIVASQCVREAAIDALGIHGGRSFLVGHPLGDSLHDHLAVTVYEGESDLLGLALFKGLCKHHPLATAHSGASAVSRAAGWLMWRAGRLGYSGGGQDNSILDESLRTFAREARRLLARLAIRMDRFLRRHGRGAASRQLEIGAFSAEMRDLLSVLAVAHHADARGDESAISIADCWCRLALSRASGTKLTAADHAAIGRLGESIVLGLLLAQKPKE
jgi:alkylation response protein AidB-like acyl-CoA dehydrogenase